MGTWKYRYYSIDTKIREGFLHIEDDDDRLAVIERIQVLRIHLDRKGQKFIDAAPVEEAEKRIGTRLNKLKKFKKPQRLKSRKRPSFLWIVFLILSALLLSLALL